MSVVVDVVVAVNGVVGAICDIFIALHLCKNRDIFPITQIESQCVVLVNKC